MKNKTIFIAFRLADNSVSDYFVELSKKFNETYNVVIFTNSKKHSTIELPENIEIKYWVSKRSTTIKDAIFLFKCMKKYKPDAIISIFGFVNMFLLVGFLCRVKHRIAWIRTISTAFHQKPFNVIRKSFIYKLSTQIIVNSNATRDDVILNYQIPEHKIKILPNSVRDVYHLIPTNENKFKTITYAGRLHPSKGVSTLIQSFELVLKKHPTLYLEIVGSGQERQKLEALVKELKIVDKVHFVGQLSKNAVLEKFKNTYISVMPSLAEAFGFTIIEAMSMKTLVIGANNTGIKETIIHNETGLLFETADEIDLAKKINLVIDDPSFRNKIAQRGYNWFIENYEIKMASERDFFYFNNLINKI